MAARDITRKIIKDLQVTHPNIHEISVKDILDTIDRFTKLFRT